MAKKNTRPVQELTYEEIRAMSDEQYNEIALEWLAHKGIRIVSPTEWYEKFSCSGSTTGRAAKAFRPRNPKE